MAEKQREPSKYPVDCAVGKLGIMQQSQNRPDVGHLFLGDHVYLSLVLNGSK